VEIPHGPVDRRGHLHECLIGLDFRDRLVLTDRVARLDEPRDQLALGDTLADVGEFEFANHVRTLRRPGCRPRSVRPGQVVVLERVQRERRVEARDAPDRCLLVEQGFLLDRRRDFTRQPTRLRGFVDDRGAAGLLERFDDCFLVQRRERPQVYDLDVDLAGEVLRCLQGRAGHCAPREHRDVRSLASDGGLTDRDLVGFVRNLLAERPVDEFRFEEDYRVRRANRARQQPLGVGGVDGMTTFSPGWWTNIASVDSGDVPARGSPP